MSGDRIGLVVGFLVFVLSLYALMFKGWRSRQRRQGDLPPPPLPPEQPGTVVLAATRGLFVGTTFAQDWLDRVAVHDLAHRAAGWILLDSNGIHIEREGLDELYLPYDRIAQAQLGDALAGKIIGKEGLVLIDWHLGDRLVTSGFRADDHSQHRRLVDAITASLPTTSLEAPS